MNGKKSKELRVRAFNATIGNPQTEYDYGQPLVYSPPFNNMGEPLPVKRLAAGSPRKMLSYCTRAVYQQMKRIYN